MVNQFRLQFYKLRHFKMFRYAIAFLVLFAVFGWIVLRWRLLSGIWNSPIDRDELESEFFAGMCDVSFVFIYSMVTAWYIGNDFDDRTVCNEVALGYSRWSTLFSRILPCWCATVILHFVMAASYMSILWFAYGYYIPEFQVRDFVWLGVILLQLLAIQSVVALITILSANAATALVISGVFTFMVNNVIRLILYTRGMEEGLRIWGTMFFTLAQDNSDRTLITAGCMAAAAIMGVTAVTYSVFRNMELK